MTDELRIFGRGRYKFAIALDHLLRGGVLRMQGHEFMMSEDYDVGVVMYRPRKPEEKAVVSMLTVGTFIRMVTEMDDEDLIQQTAYIPPVRNETHV